MSGKPFKPIEAGTAGIVGTLIFLMAWTIVERVTDSRPKAAPAGTTAHAANAAGATVTPTVPSSAQGSL